MTDLTHHIDQLRGECLRALLSLLIGATGFLVALPDAASQDTPKEETSVECVSYVPPEDRNDVGRLTLRGVACFERGQYLKALLFYRQAYELAKSPLLMAAIGRSFQELGYPEVAGSYYKSYLASSSEEGPGAKKIRQRLQAVQQQLDEHAVPVEIRSSPPGTTVSIIVHGEYWEEVGKTPLKMRLVPGKYGFVFARDGYITAESGIEVEPGDESREIDVELVDEAAAFNATSKQWRRVGVYFLLGSIPFAATTGTLVLLANQREENGDTGTAETMREWAIISGAVGATSLITGTIFYIVGAATVPEGESPADADARTVSGFIGPTGGGVVVRW